MGDNIKPIDQQVFADRLRRYQNRLYTLELDGWMVPILHGLIRLSADHPEIERLGEPTKEVIFQTRAWCLRVMRDWGFSVSQLRFLDSAMVNEQGEVIDANKGRHESPDRAKR